MADQTTLAYMNGWPKKGLETLTQEYDIDGIIVSGNIRLKTQQVEDLIQYLQTAEPGEYGLQLDFALFYKEDGNKPPISGKLTTPYVKDTSDTTKSTKTGTGKKKL